MKNFCLLFLLILPALVLAQSNYKPAYLIKLNGDTTRGFIDYKEWGNSPDYISFKADLLSAPKRYTAKIIKYFSITGYEDYQAVATSISLDPVDLSNLSTTFDNSSKTDTVFLKILQKGNNVDLLQFRDHIKQRFYIKDNQSGVIQELVYKVRLSDDEHVKNIVSYNKYYQQLIDAAQKYHKDSPLLVKQINALSYYKDDIISIIASLNDRQSEIKKIDFKNNLSSFRFFGGIGVVSNNLRFNGTTILAQNPTIGSKIGPKLTAGFDFFMNPAIRKLFFRANISLYRSHHNFSVTLGKIESTPADQTLDLTLITTSVSPQIIYNFYNGNSFKAFIGGGLAIELLSSPTDITTTTYHITVGYDPVTTKTNYPELRKIALSLPALLGVVINKKVEINGTCVLPHSITNNYHFFSGDMTSYQLTINYLFGRTK